MSRLQKYFCFVFPRRLVQKFHCFFCCLPIFLIFDFLDFVIMAFRKALVLNWWLFGHILVFIGAWVFKKVSHWITLSQSQYINDIDQINTTPAQSITLYVEQSAYQPLASMYQRINHWYDKLKGTTLDLPFESFCKTLTSSKNWKPHSLSFVFILSSFCFLDQPRNGHCIIFWCCSCKFVWLGWWCGYIYFANYWHKKSILHYFLLS